MKTAVPEIFLRRPRILGYRKNGAPIWEIAGADPEGDAAVEAARKTAEAQGKTFTEADMARARQEEKDKLYKSQEDLKAKFDNQSKEFTALQTELAEIRREREERVAAEAAKRAEAEAKAKEKHEEEISAKQLVKEKTEQLEKTVEQRLAEMQASLAEKDAIIEQERRFSELREYAQSRVAENSDNIAPELVRFINGNTPEEIDASIANAIEATNQIVEGFKSAQAQARANQRGTSTAGYTTSGPMEYNTGQESYTPDDIRNMSMADYVKNRSKLLGAAGQANNNRGLFG